MCVDLLTNKSDAMVLTLQHHISNNSTERRKIDMNASRKAGTYGLIHSHKGRASAHWGKVVNIFIAFWQLVD